MRVYICDDHEMFALAVASVLERQGHDAKVFQRPAELIQRNGVEPSDACLIDLYYGPERSAEGIEAIRNIRSVRNPPIPAPALIAITGACDAAQVSQCEAAGATALVSKSIDISQLQSTLIRAASSSSFFAINPGSTARTASLPEASLSQLTVHERLVLESMVRGEDTQTLCNSLKISQSTVRTHVQHVLVKLGVHSRLEAVAFACAAGYR